MRLFPAPWIFQQKTKYLTGLWRFMDVFLPVFYKLLQTARSSSHFSLVAVGATKQPTGRSR